MSLLEPPAEPLSDDAAAQIANCLHRLAESFQNRHFAQIRRYRRDLQPPHLADCHDRQLHLFDDACPPF